MMPLHNYKYCTCTKSRLKQSNINTSDQ